VRACESAFGGNFGRNTVPLSAERLLQNRVVERFALESPIDAILITIAARRNQ
jgi:hypothetical protein